MPTDELSLGNDDNDEDEVVDAAVADDENDGNEPLDGVGGAAT
jgi:hypothetical protein